VRRLRAVEDVRDRHALILRLGDFTGDELHASIRDELAPLLLRWYRDDPDPGVHAAIDWLLRHRSQGGVARRLDWGQAHRLARIDGELAGRPRDPRHWFVDGEGHTMVVLEGPVEFAMGSPADEPGRSPDEVQHRRRIPRSFAIATKEVTVSQFRRFLEAHPGIDGLHAYPNDPGRMAAVHTRLSPDDDGPVIAVTWYEAASYCNWLSQTHGLPESDWVYPARLEDFKSGMRMPESHLHRRGYRLPTEAEWEYAARGGTTSARFFDGDAAALKEYAWYAAHPPLAKTDPVDPNDPQRTWPVGQLKPNGFGLFDMYGNVWEWLQDRRVDYPADGAPRDDAEDAVLTVDDDQPRIRRGGSFAYGAAVMRSAHRGASNYLPMQRRDNVGFRVARTVER